MTTLKCPKHDIPLICYCPACRGEVKSERKARSSRENGKLGGRPRKNHRNKTLSAPQKGGRNG